MRLLSSFIVGALLLGCASAESEPQASPRNAINSAEVVPLPVPAPLVSHTPAVATTRQLGSTVEGRPLFCTTLGDGPETVLFVATIHGNEEAGTPLLERLTLELAKDATPLSQKRLLLVTNANPDGYASSRRFNQRNVDLNRNFPADNFDQSRRHGDAPLSEPESRMLHDLIQAERPARVVSIHQPLTCIDWDGPAEALALAMSKNSDLPAKRIGSRPGSMGSWVGVTLGIPIITLELPRKASNYTSDELWEKYGDMMLVALRGC